MIKIDLKRTTLLVAASVLLQNSQSWAHGGHDHDAPVMIAAPKGGVIKSLEKTDRKSVV